jgi:hypothetical protein
MDKAERADRRADLNKIIHYAEYLCKLMDKGFSLPNKSSNDIRIAHEKIQTAYLRLECRPRL